MQDDVAADLITIAAGDTGGCAVLPPVLGIASTDLFQFKNDGVVEHVVLGHDGQT